MLLSFEHNSVCASRMWEQFATCLGKKVREVIYPHVISEAE